MVSPQVAAAAASTRTESEARGTKNLALKLVEAQKAYSALLYCNRAGLSDEDLAEIEIKLTRARQALGKAHLALETAVAA